MERYGEKKRKGHQYRDLMNGVGAAAIFFPFFFLNAGDMRKKIEKEMIVEALIPNGSLK